MMKDLSQVTTYEKKSKDLSQVTTYEREEQGGALEEDVCRAAAAGARRSEPSRGKGMRRAGGGPRLPTLWNQDQWELRLGASSCRLEKG
jgi:hypothetical protein